MVKWLLLSLLLAGCDVPAKVSVRACGLWLSGNDMAAPDGALSQADNVVVSRDGIVETRRGYESVAAKALARLFPFKEYLVGWAAGVLSRSADGVSWADYAGTLNAPAGDVVRAAELCGNLYLTGADGVRRLDAIAGTVQRAGMEQALGLDAALYGTPGVAVAKNARVAYRAVVARQLASGQVVFGAPSPRKTVTIPSTNPDATVDLRATAYFPASALPGDRVQIYRSVASATEDTEPSDELRLVYEGIIGAPASVTQISISASAPWVSTATTAAPHAFDVGDVVRITPTDVTYTNAPYNLITITAIPSSTSFQFTSNTSGPSTSMVARTATVIGKGFIDRTPDALLGAALYTNETQQGILQRNDAPPIARDIAPFRGSMIYVNITARAQVIAALSGTLQAGDTVTINGVTYTASGHNVDEVDTRKFAITSSGTAQDKARQTVADLVRTINLATGTTDVYAAQLEGGGDAATVASFAIYARPGVSSVSFSSSRLSVFTPSRAQSVTAEAEQNGIRWSKQLEPEHVPTVNADRVASADREILRGIPTRDSFFILKREDGVFRLTGDSPDTFRIDPFDYNTHLVGAETARALDNRIWMLTEQGVVSLTDTGAELVSRPIETALQPLLVGSMRAVTESLAFAIAVESDRKYVLFLPSAATDTACTQAFVYDLITQAWTRWVLTAAHGLSNPADDRIYLVDGANVLRERKSLTDADYQDPGGATIAETIEWTPQFAEPGMFHEFQDVVLSFRRAGWGAASLSFRTDLDTTPDVLDLPAKATQDYPTIRVIVPRNKARGSLLRVKWTKDEAQAPTRLQAFTLNYHPGTAPVAFR